MNFTAPHPFRLTLPDGWIERPSVDGFDYVNDTLREQLMIAVLQVKNPPLTPDQLRDSIRELVAARREALTRLSRGNARFAPEQIDSTTASLHGTDPSNEVCFAIRFMGYPARIFTIALYKYDCVGDGSTAASRIDELTAALDLDPA